MKAWNSQKPRGEKGKLNPSPYEHVFGVDFDIYHDAEEVLEEHTLTEYIIMFISCLKLYLLMSSLVV